jgi:hypothetical protein
MKKLIFNTCVFLLFISVVKAQDHKTEKKSETSNTTLEFKLKDITSNSDSIVKPTIYVDGKLYDFDISLLNQNQIESVFVVKGEKALEEYNSPQGVIVIKTKTETTKDDFKSPSNQTEFVVKKTGDEENNDPLIIVDGKEADKNILKQLTPDDIESMEVVKGIKAKKLYNAPNGAVIIKTKKGE